MRTRVIQTNFTAGELSPRLLGRVDIAKYHNGVAVLENMMVMPHGGATRRPGFRFVAEVKDSSKKVRLIPFQFSTEQAYILEFGDQYIRFYMNQGQIMSEGSPYEISTPYTEDELAELKFTQSADVMYIVHPEHEPRKLSRTGHTSWTLTEVDFIDGPYLEKKTSPEITPSGTTGTITLTASSALFDSAHVGALWRIKHTSEWGYVKITAVTDSTHATAEVKKDLDGSGTAAAAWREGAWSAYRGYPSCVTFFEERLIFANNQNQPQTLWLSKTGSYEDFTLGDSDDDAMKITLAADQVNAIQWLVSAKVLHIGTTGGEWTLSSGALGAPLTPTNLQAKREGTHGCSSMQALLIQNQVTFVQRARRKVYRRQYSYEADGYISDELTLLAEHVTGTGLIEMAYQPAQDPILWAVRDDGVIAAMSYLGAQDVIAWHRQVTDGDFESVAVIPAASRDETWVLVKRTINGATKRYVEFMEDPDFDALEDAFYVDSGLTYDGSPATTISGLDHLVGETVAVLADGAVHPDCVVDSNGRITLQHEASKVHVGLPYTSTIKTLPVVIEQMAAGALGVTKRIHKTTARFYETVGCKTGRDLNHLDVIPFRTTSDPMDTAVPLFTGDKIIDFAGDYDTTSELYIVQDQPLPMTVLAIITELGVGD